MILQALTEYYEQLLRRGEISAPGWDGNFKVGFLLKLSTDGRLLDAADCRIPVLKGKKEVISPREIAVPAHVKRTVGIAANFLCDNSSYLLGVDEKGKPERAKQCFEACAALHRQLLDSIDSPAAHAILAFFDRWDPEQAVNFPFLTDQWKELTGNANLLFCIETAEGTQLATEDPMIREAWQNHYNAFDPEADTVQCLVTGKQAPAELVHPAIKGVPGAQSSGAALVSFNAPAFCSYGHEQGANAPISKYAAFAYTTALNLLIADRDRHSRMIGDTTVICWAESAEHAYSEAMNDFLFGAPSDSGIQDADLAAALNHIANGKPFAFQDVVLNPDEHFYILGIAPNAARLSVRFFLRDSFGAFARNLEDHADALRIIRPAFDQKENLSVWDLAQEVTNPKERHPVPPPQHTGDLLRSVLTGGRYPATLLNGVTMRIRAEQNVTRRRAAILKAYYLRNTQNDQTMIPKEVLTVELNETSSYQPYVLGRLFAVLEKLQQDANPGINATIKDRYFNSACATPAVVFPTLLKLAQKHQQKLNTASSIYYSKQISGLVSKMNADFPTRMTLPEQGAFEIGYYHQVRKNFTKKNEEE